MTESIDSFSGQYNWLSNFYPCQISLDGFVFPNVESAYVAAKTSNVHEKARIYSLSLNKPPGYIKKVGRHIELREDWEEIKLSVMEFCLRQKFAHGTKLADWLISTGDRVLIEGNTWGDTFWGVCRGVGKNHLGLLLMKIRKELQTTQFLEL